MGLASSVGAFVSIVGLIGQFQSGRAAAAGQNYDEFMQWLLSSNHDELKTMIESNQVSTIGIKAILNQDRQVLHEHLAKLDNALVAFASAIDGFAQVGQSLNPNAALSEDAISILEQIDARKCSKVMLMRVFGGGSLIPTDGHGGNIVIADWRYFEDDMRALVDAKLLIPGKNSKGQETWAFTRAAAEFMRSRDLPSA